MLSTIKSGFFTNGSLYHSTLATSNFARLLVSILKWQGCDRTIMWLYQDALNKAALGETAERRENFELRRQLIERDYDLDALHTEMVRLIGRDKRKRYGLLIALWLALVTSSIVVAAQYLDTGNLITLAGVVGTLSGLFFIVLENFVLRENTSEQLIPLAGKGWYRRRMRMSTKSAHE